MSFTINGYTQNDSTNTHGVITGSIILDSTWSPKVYLSYIPSFSKMHTMSKSMIIAETNIDGSGHFKFDTDYLPKEDNLYRIHISKKKSSPASLIIGGNDENHFFIIANSKSTIKIINKNNKINSVLVDSDPQNKIIRNIDNIVKYIDSTNFNESRIKSEFVATAFNEQLRKIADTCSHPLASLYALHKSKFEIDISNNIDFYNTFSNKWKNENTSYFKDFRAKIPPKRKINNNLITTLILCITFFLLGFLLNSFFKIKRNRKTRLLKTLSVQERKIFKLIQQGESNKEISEEYNIGLSTVKTHVSSIYSKLKIKSRKEAMNL
ncbi:MAG: helix-turn-helix transcriptional regulator [Algibacter sp.]